MEEKKKTRKENRFTKLIRLMFVDNWKLLLIAFGLSVLTWVIIAATGTAV